MTTTFESEHNWFNDQIAMYLAGGLREPSELQRFQAHAAVCPRCADELSGARKMEARMSQVFSAVMPDADFEQRLAARLQFRLNRRYRVHPMVRKAAIAAAVALMLGGVGYVGQNLGSGRSPGLQLPDPSKLIAQLIERKPRGNATAADMANEIERGAEHYVVSHDAAGNLLTSGGVTISGGTLRLINQGASSGSRSIGSLDFNGAASNPALLVVDSAASNSSSTMKIGTFLGRVAGTSGALTVLPRSGGVDSTEAIFAGSIAPAAGPGQNHGVLAPYVAAQAGGPNSSADFLQRSGSAPNVRIGGGAAEYKTDNVSGYAGGTSVFFANKSTSSTDNNLGVNRPEAIFWAGGRALDADGTTVLAAGGTVNSDPRAVAVRGGTFRLGTPGGSTANAGSITTATSGQLLTTSNGGTIDVSRAYDADGIIDNHAFATAQGTTWAGNGGNVKGSIQHNAGTASPGSAVYLPAAIAANNGTSVFSGALSNGNLTKAGPNYLEVAQGNSSYQAQQRAGQQQNGQQQQANAQRQGTNANSTVSGVTESVGTVTMGSGGRGLAVTGSNFYGVNIGTIALDQGGTDELNHTRLTPNAVSPGTFQEHMQGMKAAAAPTAAIVNETAPGQKTIANVTDQGGGTLQASGGTVSMGSDELESRKKLLAATDSASVLSGPIPGTSRRNNTFTFTAGGTTWSNPDAWLFGNPSPNGSREVANASPTVTLENGNTVVALGGAGSALPNASGAGTWDGNWFSTGHASAGVNSSTLVLNGSLFDGTKDTSIAKNGAGLLRLGDGRTGSLNVNAGTLEVASNVTFPSSTNGLGSTIDGKLNLGTGLRSLQMNGINNVPMQEMTVNAITNGSGTLVKSGTGQIAVTNSSNQPSAAIINQGTASGAARTSGNSLTSGAVTISGGTLRAVNQMASAGSGSIGSLDFKGAATNAGLLALDGTRNTFGNNGTSGLHVTQGTVNMVHRTPADPASPNSVELRGGNPTLDIGAGTVAVNVTMGNHSVQVPTPFPAATDAVKTFPAGALTTGATAGPGTVISNSAATPNAFGSTANFGSLTTSRSVNMDGPSNVGTASFKPASAFDFSKGNSLAIASGANNSTDLDHEKATTLNGHSVGTGNGFQRGTGPNSTGSPTIEERMQLRRTAESAPVAGPLPRQNAQGGVGGNVTYQDAPTDSTSARTAQSGGALITSDALAQAATQPNRGPGGGAITTQQQANAQNAASARRIIREGTMEFEVDSFDSAFNQIATIVGEEGGFIAAADSDKLPNGKVRGQITVRVPPDRLDLLVLKLRALGELKSQKLGSRDIGKEYTDLESEMRANRAMEQRLIDIIAKAPGKVNELLEAEKELGEVRARIEKTIGLLTYFSNLISMATLTINAYERDIRTPASANVIEDVNVGVETEDVETARSEALKAIDAVKGRIVESTLQKLEAGQFAAKIVAEVSSENAGPIVDRLKQLGRIARYDVQKKQVIENPKPGVAAQAQPPVRLETIPTRIIISMYNLANVAPRLTTNLNLAGDDVETVYRAILKRIADAGGRVVSSNLNRQDAAQVSGSIQFEIKTPDADAVLNDVRNQALVLRMTVTENPDTANVTTAKQAFTAQIIPTSQLSSKLMTNLNLAAQDVEAVYNNVLKRINASAGARVITSNLNRQDASQISGTIQFEVKTPDADAVLNDIRSQGLVLRMNVTENADGVNVTTTKRGYTAQIVPIAQLSPKFTTNLSLAAADVETTYRAIMKIINDSAGSRVISSNLNRQDAMQAVGALQFEVSNADAPGVLDKLRQNVQVLQLNVVENPSRENVTPEKQAFYVQVIPTSQVQPRETRQLGIQTSNVEGAVQVVNAAVSGAGGRIVESSMSQDRGGNSVARMVVEVPLDKVEAVADSIRKQGTVRASESNKNTQIPEGPLSRARLNLTIATGETIVPVEGGFSNSVREGLSTSVKGLLWSLQLIVIGLCLIGPWVLMVWGGWRFARKRKAAKAQ